VARLALRSVAQQSIQLIGLRGPAEQRLKSPS
jgi:hypothetical protein